MQLLKSHSDCYACDFCLSYSIIVVPNLFMFQLELFWSEAGSAFFFTCNPSTYHSFEKIKCFSIKRQRYKIIDHLIITVVLKTADSCWTNHITSTITIHPSLDIKCWFNQELQKKEVVVEVVHWWFSLVANQVVGFFPWITASQVL